MPRSFHHSCLPYLLRHTYNSRLLAFISIFCCTYILWLQFSELSLEEYDQGLVDEALQNAAQNPKYADMYRKEDHLSSELKFILLWTPEDWEPFVQLRKGQRAFVINNCSNFNCYVTSNKSLFKGDLEKFHAIAFNGRNLDGYTKKDLPQTRYQHQKYIYFNQESAHNYPVCDEIFDDFYNWTATYKLDSDIIYPYFLIRNASGDVIGPREDIEWIDDMEDVDENLANRLRNKTKAAAWFVSNCKSIGGREKFVMQLEKELNVYGIDIDIYGACGRLECPRFRQPECQAMLESDYFFYLSLENSFAEDYVTEKLLTALQNNVIPIVYGGADYSRFLPPNSYLIGRNTHVKQLATTMKWIIESPEVYKKFFRWKKYYKYEDSVGDNVCRLCAALNDEKKFREYSSYEDFRDWWNTDSACKNPEPE